MGNEARAPHAMQIAIMVSVPRRRNTAHRLLAGMLGNRAYGDHPGKNARRLETGSYIDIARFSPAGSERSGGRMQVARAKEDALPPLPLPPTATNNTLCDTTAFLAGQGQMLSDPKMFTKA
ncbi:jg15142 [Pararge aegeria aegeria]|uniref:Jg15142 protein n=1 Tax=Pararge aegeria aegeria TaxID=348720 RepID=A0A8S4S0K8_9NEOP|nr:jg15142 [Pararge aegeria aegeria]